jgi:hypothetical protein
MENSVKSKVVNYLRHLGLDATQAAIYIWLQAHGSSSVLAISKGVGTGRTKLYPALEQMIALQVMTKHDRHYGTTYQALPPQNLEFLVLEQERKASSLRASLTSAVSALSSLASSSPSSTNTIEYSGVDGLKQMNYNIHCKSVGNFKVFELANLDKHLAPSFAERMRQNTTDNKVKSFDLTNNLKWKLNTKVAGYRELSQASYIDPAVFHIKFETYIYNNVVGLIKYDKDDIFGIEIYNQDLKDQQEQIFDLLWSMSRPI